MRQEIIYEEMLRNILEEAKRKGQFGLFIWANEDICDYLAKEIVPGKETYDFAVYELKMQRETRRILDASGDTIFLSVPVEKLMSNDEFFKSVLKKCDEELLLGPVTLIPLNQSSDYCY